MSRSPKLPGGPATLLTVLLAVVAAVVIVVLGGRDSDRRVASDAPAQDAHVERKSQSQSQSKGETVHSHDEPDPPAGLRPEESAARRAAGRFLAGYLPYTYGAGPAREIRSVAAPLRRELAAAPPRVPAADRRLEPEVQSIELVRSRGELGIDFEARVTDERRRYSVFLGVRSSGDRWLVVALW